jgi:hypothetical protein
VAALRSEVLLLATQITRCTDPRREKTWAA